MSSFTHPSMASFSPIEKGIAAAKAGDLRQARELLANVLAGEPRNERAWLWFSGVVGSDAERRYCLEQVLLLNPSHAVARHGLTQLPASLAPIAPQCIADAERPTIPCLVLAPKPEALLPATGPSTRLAEPQAALSIATYAPPPVMPAPLGSPAPSDRAAAAWHAELVVRALGSGRSPEEACRMLCEQHSYAWEQAHDLVNSVVAQHRVQIARRQAPFLLFLGVTTLLGGLGLLGLGLLRLRTVGYVSYTPLAYRNMILALVSGLLMVLGSGIGLAQVLRSLWK